MAQDPTVTDTSAGMTPIHGISRQNAWGDHGDLAPAGVSTCPVGRVVATQLRRPDEYLELP